MLLQTKLLVKCSQNCQTLKSFNHFLTEYLSNIQTFLVNIYSNLLQLNPLFINMERSYCCL